MYGTIWHPIRPEVAAAFLLPPEILVPILVLAVALAIVLDRYFPLRPEPARHQPRPRPVPQVDEATEAQVYEWLTSSSK